MTAQPEQGNTGPALGRKTRLIKIVARPGLAGTKETAGSGSEGAGPGSGLGGGLMSWHGDLKVS